MPEYSRGCKGPRFKRCTEKGIHQLRHPTGGEAQPRSGVAHRQTEPENARKAHPPRPFRPRDEQNLVPHPRFHGRGGRTAQTRNQPSPAAFFLSLFIQKRPPLCIPYPRGEVIYHNQAKQRERALLAHQSAEKSDKREPVGRSRTRGMRVTQHAPKQEHTGQQVGPSERHTGRHLRMDRMHRKQQARRPCGKTAQTCAPAQPPCQQAATYVQQHIGQMIPKRANSSQRVQQKGEYG